MKRPICSGELARILGAAVVLCSGALSLAQAPPSKPEFPPFDEVTKDFEAVNSSMDGSSPLFNIWVRRKDNQMLAELPKSYATDRHFIALTVSSGERYAGLQAGEMYVYWRRYDDRLALIEPNVAVRSTGDQESKSSVDRLFTDRVILDVPIVTLSNSKVPVIDMDMLLVGMANKFFPSARGVNPRLATIKTAKAFPENVELSFEVPMDDGRLKTLHYSISRIPKNTGYQPRIADQRVGYFTTSYVDLGKYKEDETRVRFINRWHLEKADPGLKLSPTKKPIVFYIEHTTPKRYRHWVRQGIEQWNKAFEQVGLRNAIEVRQQDPDAEPEESHMDKDPEDVRYNFVRWLNNDVGTAIGPSRVDPMTGQILDADIILTDGWIRHFEKQYNEVLPRLAMEGFSPQTVAWLNAHPRWDPRIQLASPAERPRLTVERSRMIMQPYGGHPAAMTDSTFIGDDEYDGLIGRNSQINGLCLAAEGKSLDLTVLRTTLSLLAAEEDEEKEKEKEKEKKEGEKKDEAQKDDEKKEVAKDDEKKEEKPKEGEKKDDSSKDDKKKEEEGQILDGVPESFIGPLIAELVAHEVGHTLGLRHNFKASSVYSLEEITKNTLEEKANAGSVMDYLPINMVMKEGKIQGNHTMKTIGPYDMWAIEYGYSFEKDLKPVLSRVAEPELVYGTDEDTWGPDPRARRYDFSKNPLDYARSQMDLAKFHRERLLEKFVKEGDSWAKAREGYEMSLALQTRSLSMMANWIGGTFLSRDKKGDKNARQPLEVVPADMQRQALQWVIQDAFRDEAFGLTPELMRHLSTDQWLDDMSFFSSDSDWPVHDRIMGIQSATLTMLMNPDTLRLVYDNEARSMPDEDVVTLPELLDAISSEIWSELNSAPVAKATARKPWISSLRRNLQTEHLERLIDLTMPDSGFTAAYKPISNLALMRLRLILGKVKEVKDSPNLDPYSAAHLQEVDARISKALDAQYIYNATDRGGRNSGMLFFFEEQQKQGQ